MTTRIVKSLYILAIVLAGLVCLQFLAMGFYFRGFMTLLFLVMGVVIFAGLVLLARVALEMVIVTFRIAEDLRMLRSNTPGSVQPPDDEAMERQE